MSQLYNVSEMKQMVIKYVHRMFDASLASAMNVDLSKEPVILKLERADLEKMLSDSDCKGLFCILALNDDKGYDAQTTILVPFDKNEKALPDASNVIKGLQRHPIKPALAKAVVYPNGSTEPDIVSGVDDAFRKLGM